MTQCINCGCSPIDLDSGRVINRRLWINSELVKLKERILSLEKASRKTPPKTLLAEVKKVQQAKENLITALEFKVELETELNNLSKLEK